MTHLSKAWSPIFSRMFKKMPAGFLKEQIIFVLMIFQRLQTAKYEHSDPKAKISISFFSGLKEKQTNIQTKSSMALINWQGDCSLWKGPSRKLDAHWDV